MASSRSLVSASEDPGDRRGVDGHPDVRVRLVGGVGRIGDLEVAVGLRERLVRLEALAKAGDATIEPHSDIDLWLLDSGGSLRDYSVSLPSVFERARVESPAEGTWTLRVHGYKVAASEQTVYWAMAGHRR